MSKLAFLGAGNMAAAIAEGLLAGGSLSKNDLSCLSGSGKTAAALASRTGIRLADSLPDLIQDADALIIAFKPQHLSTAGTALAELTAGKLIISVLAGKKIPALHSVFPKARNIVRFMPNTPAAIGAGMTGWCPQSTPSPDDRQLIENVLNAMGRSVEIPESQMDALTAISGCGPAFLFEFVAALREAGVAAGLSPEISAVLASETVLGSARLLARKQIDPEILRNQVTSPNGVTFAGLKKMEAGDFRGLIKATVLTAKARSEELSKD